MVDGGRGPIGVLDGRRFGADGALEGPVDFVRRAGDDPAGEYVDLLWREIELGVGGGHLVAVGCGDAAEEFGEGVVGRLRDGGDAFGGVEAEFGLALGVVGAVAFEAVVGEDGADFAGEVRRVDGEGCGGEED